MNKRVLIMLAVLFAACMATFARDIRISDDGDVGTNFQIDCTNAMAEATTNVYFYDDGLNGNYTAGRTYVKEITSGNNGSINIKFTQFNLATGTVLTIKDAISQQILVSNATGSSLNGQTFTSHRGSLQFIWSSGSATAAGFKAKVWCGAMCQVFSTSIVPSVAPSSVVNPQSGETETFYDVCPNSEVTFTATSEFTQNNFQYTQSESTLNYTWAVVYMGNTTYINTGEGGNSFSYNFPHGGGFYVFCDAADQYGCLNRNVNTKRLRVSIPPTWENVDFGPDNVCPGTQVSFTGAPTPHSWEYEIPTVLGDTAFLPDGSGVCYNSALVFENVFPETATITSVNDIESIYMNIEHSYLGDLSILMQCPSGQSCLLHAYSSSTPTIVPGWSLSSINNPNSVGGTTIHLGLAPDPSDEDGPCYTAYGEGYAYNFTPNATQPMGGSSSLLSNPNITSETYTDPCGRTETFNVLNAGNYATYESMSSLIGCPLNGEWRIFICDHLPADNGWIFQWGISFRDDLYLPNVWEFENTYSTSTCLWSGENMNAAPGSATATAVVQNPDAHNASLIPYTFHATDNFGCTYDTTVTVNVLASLDPSCCIQPTPNATAGNTAPCSNSTTLTVGGYSMTGNTGEWTYTTTTGGFATFSAPNSPTTSVSVNVYGDYTFTWHEYYQGNQSCSGESSVNVNFARQMNAALTDIPSTCRSGSMIVLEAQDFGTLTCTPSTNAFSAEARTFTPGLAAPGTYTIRNQINGERCADPSNSTVTFSVYDELSVTMDDPICTTGATPTVTLNFTITGSNGTPPPYMIGYTYTPAEDNGGTAVNDTLYNQSSGTYTMTGASALEYAFAFIDNHRCSSVSIPGYYACECPNYSGAFADYSARIRCTGESIPLGHDGNQTTDALGGVFSFVVCTNPSDIVNTHVCTLAGSTTSISSTDIPGFTYNTQYYVVAVAGYGSGISAWSAAGCRSVSRPIPVMWKQTPQPQATGGETCGRVITLNGTQPSPGMQGYWTASAEGIANYSYTTINGTDNTMYNATVFSNFDGPVSFVWHIANDECVGESPAVIYKFNKIPTPEAGYDRTVCGLSAEILGANATQPPIQGAVLTWTGSGVIMTPANEIQPTANANTSGTYTITLTERNGTCVGSDDVRITFIDVPAPVITTNVDTVCGHSAELQVYNSNPANGGHWTAYNMQGQVVPAVIYRAYGNPNLPSDDTYTHCFATVEIPGDVTEIEYEFRWAEPVNDPRIPAGEECLGVASKHIVFRKVPSVSVHQCGATGDFTTVCGRTVELCADTHASDGFASYMWLNKDVNGSYSDSLSNQTTFTLDSMYTITNYMDIPFYFTARNGNCMVIDTMNVRFLEMPQPSAGNDNAVCGYDYELHGVWGISPTENYTPYCRWTCLSVPGNQWPNIPNVSSITLPITVPQSGIYTFEILEYNTAGMANQCFNRDTVTIEFMKQPHSNAGDDQIVCGLDFVMDASSSHQEGDSIMGSWTCLSGGQAAFTDRTDPHTTGHYSSYGAAVFQWIETNRPHIEIADPVTCASYDSVVITFFERPTARINMNIADTVICGPTTIGNDFCLRAEPLGSGMSGQWIETGGSFQSATFTDDHSSMTDVTVFQEGRHYFQWVVSTGPEGNLDPHFCADTSAAWPIDFITKPVADIVRDSIQFCQKDGALADAQVNFNGVGEGLWTVFPEGAVTFDDPTDPHTFCHSLNYNSSSTDRPYYMLYWRVQNTRFCSAQDSLKVRFVQAPSDSMTIIPPKCFGEPAIIAAYDTSLVAYDWDFGSGITDSVVLNQHNGQYMTFVHWDDKDSLHVVGLITTNKYECQSPIGQNRVIEPPLPEYHYNIIQDTCSLGRGGIEFLDTTGRFAFYWTDTTERSANIIGPNPVTGAISSYHVYQLPTGIYSYRSEYPTPNNFYQNLYLNYFGTYQCIDYPEFEIGTIGMIKAEFAVSADVVLSDLVAPDAQVTFVNSTDYDNIGKKCEWHYGDGIVEKNCDELVEHIYAEPGCYEPYLVVMNRDLPECRDTAYLDLETVCGSSFIYVDKASMLEIPNIFSPNGDGINDYFQVHAQTLKKFNGKIINRYGRLVYEWTDWETEDAGWDGRLNGTTKATPGVYYYIIEAEGYDGQPYSKQGPIHLVR